MSSGFYSNNKRFVKQDTEETCADNTFLAAKNHCFQPFINTYKMPSPSSYYRTAEDESSEYSRENDTSIYQMPSTSRMCEEYETSYSCTKEHQTTRPSRIDIDSKKLSKKRGAVKEVYKNTKNPYDLSFDLAFFKNTLKQGTFLDDSGYKSAAMDKSISSPAGSSSRNRNVLLTSSYYGTGWLMAENLTPEDETNCLEWEAQMTVGGEKLKVNEVRDILHTNFAFISGAVTREGHPIMTFPDSKSQITFEQYHLLITYLIPLTKDCQKGFVLVIDRRNDKWSSLRILFSYIMNHFPEPISLICLLKPEGVFQRALEVGYRNFFDSTKYKVVICQSTTEMAEYLGADRLTVDVGGKVKYDHKNWIDDAMDIERMKSSASAIAESLNNFAKCLRETELPNDVETTERILNVQTNDRDAIKEDFRIAIRKGLSLLRHIRQAEEKPFADELSPTRYHNVTAVERMLIQLEETEISFDTFWEKHRLRLSNCLHLRIFEERFRKLQANFARNMIYLEEHREVGDCVERAVELAKEHDEYIKTAKEDVDLTEELRKEGDELISKHQDNELSGSLLPKCDELTRMSDALNSAFTRRTEVLKLSKTMHEQISEANIWCKNGVELLSNIPLEMTTTSASTAIKRMDEFLNNGARLQLEPFNAKQTINSLILLTTTDTSTLLAQVAERIDDLRRLGVAKRTSLLKFTTEREAKKPVQIVSPEKSTPPIPPKKQSLYSAISIEDESKSTTIEKQIEIIHDFQQCTVVEDMPSTAAFPMETNMKQESNCIANFVLAELMNTEQSYVRELASLVENYMVPFENLENTNTLAPAVRGKSHIIFGNLRGLLEYHNNVFLSELLAAADDVTSICHIFVRERHHLLSLYRPYCQNKSHSESFRKEYVEGKKFFVECQKRAGHPLPLSAYLLKPIQRITKYQLMLKELHRHSAEEFRPDLQAALASMLDLLGQLNADMRQLRISSFNGDISLLGNLRLQAECEVMNFKKKTKRYNKSQKRNIFLFDNAVLLCKKRSQPMPITPEYYEHKVCLPINCLGFSELSKAGSDKFEIWDESKADGFAVFIAEDTARMKWIQKLRRHIASTLEKDPNNDKVPELAVKTDYFDVNVIQRNKRPQSWTSTASTESTSSSRVSCEDGSIDPNGNRSSIASINEECQELERFEKCDAADNNSTHVTSIHIPPLDESNKDISTTNNHMIDTRSISDSGIQSRTGPITISESADCVSTAC